jgi:hypothetical protein
MKRSIAGLAVAVAALAIPAGAGAAGSPAQCAAHDMVWATPGKMFQAARADLGVNPAALAGVHGLTVGQLVEAGCRS